jgi:hypothetical protein
MDGRGHEAVDLCLRVLSGSVACCNNYIWRHLAGTLPRDTLLNLPSREESEVIEAQSSLSDRELYVDRKYFTDHFRTKDESLRWTVWFIGSQFIFCRY